MNEGSHKIAALLTAVTDGYDRISMHGVRRVLLEAQAIAVGVPLEKVFIPQNASNQEYEDRMREVLLRCMHEKHIRGVVFGDIFLQDVREYREKKLEELRLSALFPLWKRDTEELAHEFVSSGFRAVVCCVDTRQMDASFCGAEFDEDFIDSLPDGVDPCGENGEFHTFVYNGPIFSGPIGITKGKIVMRDNRFCFIDLLPAGTTVE